MAAATVVNPIAARWIVEPKRQNVWGMPHAAWFLLMGLGAALFLGRAVFSLELGRVVGVSLADLTGFILIGVGGLVLIGDLGRPWRFLRALRNFRRSWISVGVIADFTFVGVTLALMLADLDLGAGRVLAFLPQAGATIAGVALEVVAGAAALVIIVYPGLVLAFSPAIPFWHTTLIPLQYLAYAFSSAIGLVLLSTLWQPRPVGSALILAEFGLLAASGLLVTAHLINGANQRSAGRVSVEFLLRGAYRLPFWIGAVVVGLAAPAAMLALAALLVGPAWLPAAAGGLAIAGNWFAKLSVLRAGFFAPLA